MATTIAGIDVHKKVLAVVLAEVAAGEVKVTVRKRFGATASELSRLRLWLQEQGVGEAVMEATAQYWRPVWMELEPCMKLHLAQAFSNPRGVGASWTSRMPNDW